MDAQILRAVGSIAGLAGLAVGMILLLYREIVRKNIFPTLTKRDAYRLLRNLAVLAWSIAVVGIFCWVWSTTILHPQQPAATASPAPAAELPVVAGTVVDQATNLGIGQATVAIDGQGLTSISDDSGNFRIVLSEARIDQVRLSVTKGGYVKVDRSVVPPSHDLILQMRRKVNR
jgi:hypothetical protein